VLLGYSMMSASRISITIATMRAAKSFAGNASAWQQLDHWTSSGDFIGDGVMAPFGLPTPYGDDADRAVATARTMQRTLRLLNERLAGPTLKIGIGSGPVITDRIGSPERMNYTVIGELQISPRQ
jgi:hypothetical protein